MPPTTDLPIVIKTRNRLPELLLTLDSLLASQYSRSLLILDDASDGLPMAKLVLAFEHASGQEIRADWPTTLATVLGCQPPDPLPLSAVAAREISRRMIHWPYRVGCCGGHFLAPALALAARPTADACIVLEDDIVFRPDWLDKLLEAATRLDQAGRPWGVISGYDRFAGRRPVPGQKPREAVPPNRVQRWRDALAVTANPRLRVKLQQQLDAVGATAIPDAPAYPDLYRIACSKTGGQYGYDTTVLAGGPCYLVNRKLVTSAAKAFRAAYDPTATHGDALLQIAAFDAGLECWQIQPSIVQHTGLRSIASPQKTFLRYDPNFVQPFARGGLGLWPQPQPQPEPAAEPVPQEAP